MGTDSLIQNYIFLTLNWLCVFSFPLMMKYLISKSIQQNNPNTVVKSHSDGFLKEFDPFTAINKTSYTTSDLALILFRKSITLLAVSIITLLMSFWALSGKNLGTLNIISTFVMFYIFVKFMTNSAFLSFQRFILLTSILVLSLLGYFYVSSFWFIVLCLFINLFIAPLYMFYLNKRSLSLDIWVFSFAYVLNLLSFASILVYFKSSVDLIIKYSNEIGVLIAVALGMIVFISYMSLLLGGGINRINQHFKERREAI